MHAIQIIPTPAIFQLLVMQQSAYNNVQMAFGLGPIKGAACHLQSSPKHCLWSSGTTPSRLQTGIHELTLIDTLQFGAMAPAVGGHVWGLIEYATRSHLNPTVLQESEQVMRQRRESFYPAYTKLVSLIRGRVRFPEQYEALHEDEKRDFKAARYAVADTLLDAAGAGLGFRA